MRLGWEARLLPSGLGGSLALPRTGYEIGLVWISPFRLQSAVSRSHQGAAWLCNLPPCRPQRFAQEADHE